MEIDELEADDTKEPEISGGYLLIYGIRGGNRLDRFYVELTVE